eukprot:1898201-Karenia_brevis.AAC.1
MSGGLSGMPSGLGNSKAGGHGGIAVLAALSAAHGSKIGRLSGMFDEFSLDLSPTHEHQFALAP